MKHNKSNNFAPSVLDAAKLRQLLRRYAPQREQGRLMIHRKVAISLLAFIAAFISTSAYPRDVMNAEFRTLKACLSAIEKNGGGPLKIITDKPEEVSGFLSSGEGFACERKITGSKGLYYHGWFMVK